MVRLDTGQVFPAQFSYHGPDTDIRCSAVTVIYPISETIKICRALRLNSESTLHNIYDPLSGQIVITPFSYKVLPDAHLWLKKADSFILRYCSTSPAVEPPHFCDQMRSKFRRMISDPAPDTVFPGGRARVYSR